MVFVGVWWLCGSQGLRSDHYQLLPSPHKACDWIINLYGVNESDYALLIAAGHGMSMMEVWPRPALRSAACAAIKLSTASNSH